MHIPRFGPSCELLSVSSKQETILIDALTSPRSPWYHVSCSCNIHLNSMDKVPVHHLRRAEMDEL